MFLGKTIFYLFLFIKCMSLKPKGWKLFKCSFKKCFLVNIYRAEGKDVQVVTLNDLCKVQWFIQHKEKQI